MPVTVNIVTIAKTNPIDLQNAIDAVTNLLGKYGFYVKFSVTACQSHCRTNGVPVCKDHYDLAHVACCPAGKSQDWAQEVQWLGPPAAGSNPYILMIDIGSATNKPKKKPGDAGGCRYRDSPMAAVDPDFLVKWNHLAIAHELGHLFGLTDQQIAWNKAILRADDPLRNESDYKGYTFMYTNAPQPFVASWDKQAMVTAFFALGTP